MDPTATMVPARRASMEGRRAFLERRKLKL
jgi:hypothetical protein